MNLECEFKPRFKLEFRVAMVFVFQTIVVGFQSLFSISNSIAPDIAVHCEEWSVG